MADFPTSKPNLKTDYADDTDDVDASNQNEPNDELNKVIDKVGIDDSTDADSLDCILRTGWNPLTSVVPTRASADDPTYVLTFAGVDLTNELTEGCPVKFTQNGADVFGWISKDSTFSTNTTVTLYCGTDYDVLDTSTYPITNFRVGLPEQPGVGFPLDKDIWTVEVTDSSIRSQATPTTGNWYNVGTTNCQIVAPIGSWDFFGTVMCEVANNIYPVTGKITLSTANNTESNPETTITDEQQQAERPVASGAMTGYFSFSSKTTLYLNGKAIPNTGTSDTIWFRNDIHTMVLRLVCAYL
jgi:hypothetical protein